MKNYTLYYKIKILIIKNMNENSKLGILGIACRANKLIFGTEQVINNIRKNKIYLVLLAKDSSENTKKKITDKCKYYNILLNIEFTNEQLNKAIGKQNVMVVGVTDINFTNGLK